MPDFNRLQKLVIKWTYPRDIERVNESEYADKHGVYVITRIFKGQESLIYIGKTERYFSLRLSEHFKKHENTGNCAWLAKKGQKRVRFGIFSKAGFDESILIDDVESALIQDAIEQGCTTLTNDKKTVNCCVHYKLHIFNSGFPGPLSREITFRPDAE